jgi:protein-tyrosine-phosphatase
MDTEQVSPCIVTPCIVIVGGANTGRSAIAVAMLRYQLAQRGLAWKVTSAGVLGHDGDYAEPEAISAMYALNYDITDHCAQSLTADIIQHATILVTVDSSIIYVLRSQFPDAMDFTVTLGDLAGRKRDIPDPFRMQVATWITYAREIQNLLEEGLDALVARVKRMTETAEPTTVSQPAVGHTEGVSPSPDGMPIVMAHAGQEPVAEDHPRIVAVQRCEQVVKVLRDMPALVDWNNARRQLETEIQTINAAGTLETTSDDDFIQSYAGLLVILLRSYETIPEGDTLDQLERFLCAMAAPIRQEQITQLAAALS